MNYNFNANFYTHYNLTNLIINNLINRGTINHPIDQIVSNKYPVGTPVVDGYVFRGWDKNTQTVEGRLTNDFSSSEQTRGIPQCQPVVVGRPVLPSNALEVCVWGSKRLRI